MSRPANCKCICLCKQPTVNAEDIETLLSGCEIYTKSKTTVSVKNRVVDIDVDDVKSGDNLLNFNVASAGRKAYLTYQRRFYGDRRILRIDNKTNDDELDDDAFGAAKRIAAAMFRFIRGESEESYESDESEHDV